MNYYKQAAERLKKECSGVTGTKESAMKTAVMEALLQFAKRNEEFAQAIVQGGTFGDCMKAVAKGVGNSVSDLEAYGRAAAFYFPGSKVSFEMHIDLIGDAADAAPQEEEKSGLIVNLADFL